MQALISYALRLCRLSEENDAGHDEQWKNELQPIFDKQVDQVQVGEVENYEIVMLSLDICPIFYS